MTWGGGCVIAEYRKTLRRIRGTSLIKGDIIFPRPRADLRTDDSPDSEQMKPAERQLGGDTLGDTLRAWSKSKTGEG